MYLSFTYNPLHVHACLEYIYMYICSNTLQIDVFIIILTCTLNSPNSVPVTVILYNPFYFS